MCRNVEVCVMSCVSCCICGLNVVVGCDGAVCVIWLCQYWFAYPCVLIVVYVLSQCVHVFLFDG